MPITPAALTALRKDLADLPPKKRDTLTAKDVVHSLHSDLAAARANGHTLADLAGILSSRAISISASTLGTYLRALSSDPASTQQEQSRPRANARP
ncbi:hypothetical protein ACW9UR_23735 [Halovulum sp. GXIMD14794]